MLDTGWVKSPTSDPEFACCVFLRRHDGLVEFCATEIPNQPVLAFTSAEAGKFFDQITGVQDVASLSESLKGAIQVRLVNGKFHLFDQGDAGRIIRITRDEWTAFCDGVGLGAFDYLRDEFDSNPRAETAEDFVSRHPEVNLTFYPREIRAFYAGVSDGEFDYVVTDRPVLVPAGA